MQSELVSQSIKLTTFKDDFFPLLQQYTGSYWNGYYTSRPNFKTFIRNLGYMSMMSSRLYSFEQMRALATDDISQMTGMSTTVMRNYAI